MKRTMVIGIGIFCGMVATAFILRHELRRAPEVKNEVPRLTRLEELTETQSQRLARLHQKLRAEERRQRPEEGRN